MNWVLTFGVVSLGMALFLTWLDRRKARRQLWETIELYFTHGGVMDGDPPQETKGE